MNNKMKSKKMFDITIEDIKHSTFNTNEDRIDYLLNKASYPYGWFVDDIGTVKEDGSYFIFKMNGNKFSLEKRDDDPFKIDDDRGVFITADVVDFHAPSDSIYKDRIKVSKLYKDPTVVGNLCYLKKKEIISQVQLSDKKTLVKVRSYNGPILVQGKRFFMCNGSTWIITYQVTNGRKVKFLSRSPESLHIYGWGYVLGIEIEEVKKVD